MAVLGATQAALGQTSYIWTGGCASAPKIWNNNSTGCCDASPCCTNDNWSPSTCAIGRADAANIPRGFEVTLTNPLAIGTLNVNGLLNVTQNLTIHNSAAMQVDIDSNISPIINALGPVTLNGISSMGGAILAGGGGFNVAMGGELIMINSTTPNAVDATLLTNEGQVSAISSLAFRNDAIVINAATWRAQGSHGGSAEADQFGNFLNAGDVLHVVNATTAFTVPFGQTSGSIQATGGGTLSLRRGGTHSGGQWTVQNGSTLEIAGFNNDGSSDGLHISGAISANGVGTVNLIGDRAITIQPGGSLATNLTMGTFPASRGLWLGGQADPVVRCNGPINNHGLMTWSAGTVNGSTGFANAKGGTLDIKVVGFSSGPRLEQATIFNLGTVNQSQDLTLAASALVTNVGAMWKLSDADILIDGSGTFENISELIKDGPNSSNSSRIDCAFNNTGTVRASVGAIDFRGGGELNGEFTIENECEMRFSQGVYDVSAANISDSGTLRLNGGIWNVVPGSPTTLQGGAGDTVFEGGQILGEGVINSNRTVHWNSGVLALGSGANGEFLNGGGGIVLISTSGAPSIRTLAGQLTNVGTVTAGSLLIDGGQLLNNGTLSLSFGSVAAGPGGGAIINNGDILKNAPGTMTIAATLTNNGSVRVVQGPLALTGTMTNLVGGSLLGGSWQVDPGASLNMPGASITTLPDGTTIRMGGGASWGALQNNLTLNGGLVQATGVGIVNFNPPGRVLQNTGNLESADGGTLNVNGVIQSDEDAELSQLPGLDSNVAGTGGGFVADAIENSGTILPGGANAPGSFHLTGDLVCHDSSIMVIDLAGRDPIGGHDHILVAGHLSLGGTLAINVLPGFSPTIGQQFTIITASGGAIAGEFEDIAGTGQYSITYNPTSVVLTVLALPVNGDLNGDTLVNAADLAILLGAWSIPPGTPGCNGASPCAADLNGDGLVNAADLAILLGAWTLP